MNTEHGERCHSELRGIKSPFRTLDSLLPEGDSGSSVHGSCRGLKNSLDTVMYIVSILQVDVEVQLGVVGKSSKKLFKQFNIHIAQPGGGKGGAKNQMGSPAAVNRYGGQSIDHRDRRASESFHAFLIGQGFTKGASQTNTDIFHCVVKIHIRIPGGAYLKIEKTMFGKEG
jgi:hypothetical protein